MICDFSDTLYHRISMPMHALQLCSTEFEQLSKYYKYVDVRGYILKVKD